MSLDNRGDVGNPVFATADDALLLDKIRAFIADAADCGIERVGPDDDIYADLHVDSLGAIAIFIDMSYEFHIPEPSSEVEYQSLNTARKLFSNVRALQNNIPDVPTLRSSDVSTIDAPRLLPYGDAFRFIGSVSLFETNRIVTQMTWTPESAFLAAHFRDGPHVVPGVLLAEQVAQSALLLARLDNLVGPDERLMLAQLRCEFPTSAEAPVTTVADVHFRSTGLGHFGFLGVCRIVEREVARVKGIAVRSAVGSNA